jgi:membrane associated rhomboid family serine protease
LQNRYPEDSGPQFPDGGQGAGGGVRFALPPLTPITKKLMIINVAIFFAAWLLNLISPEAKEAVYSPLSLNPAQWKSWFPFLPVWQLVTSGFLHSTYQLTHVFWNMLQLYFFGTMLEAAVGSRRFLTTYIGALLAGSFLHLFVSFASATPVPSLGASGAVLGVVVAMATLRPHTKVILFVIPVKLMYLAGFIVLYDLMTAVSNLRTGGSDGVAHWVHLGGALFGFLTVRLGWIRIDWLERFRARRLVANEQERRENHLKMDVLLEKIHREGMSALTKAERAFLKRASSRK